ncbi:hypothetical protein EYF80_049111 [Liparis tanakae]|uniref:Uncharacterized protein n=1 Tax=Liparis tanakae TaxID=230148 RepID=A0A4Z2FIE8_9TELE|nr:hypothetical protein EYF80_049111 [Liparis tanakae]
MQTYTRSPLPRQERVDTSRGEEKGESNRRVLGPDVEVVKPLATLKSAKEEDGAAEELISFTGKVHAASLMRWDTSLTNKN